MMALFTNFNCNIFVHNVEEVVGKSHIDRKGNKVDFIYFDDTLLIAELSNVSL